MLNIVKTADGSSTIFNAEVGEHYHSKHGALQESRHVFVNSGLGYFLEQASAPSIVSILEVGFGTGLNLLLTADFCADKKIVLNYTGIEAYPLSAEMISQTGYDQYVSAALWNQFMDNYNQLLLSPTDLTAQCKLQIADCKLMDFQSEKQYDVIYFDAFASANHQPSSDT